MDGSRLNWCIVLCMLHFYSTVHTILGYHIPNFWFRKLSGAAAAMRPTNCNLIHFSVIYLVFDYYDFNIGSDALKWFVGLGRMCELSEWRILRYCMCGSFERCEGCFFFILVEKLQYGEYHRETEQCHPYICDTQTLFVQFTCNEWHSFMLEIPHLCSRMKINVGIPWLCQIVVYSTGAIHYYVFSPMR